MYPPKLYWSKHATLVSLLNSTPIFIWCGSKVINRRAYKIIPEQRVSSLWWIPIFMRKLTATSIWSSWSSCNNHMLNIVGNVHTDLIVSEISPLVEVEHKWWYHVKHTQPLESINIGENVIEFRKYYMWWIPLLHNCVITACVYIHPTMVP